MNPFTLLVLPQNDTPENRAKRQEALTQAQAQYRYDYPAIVAGLPMAAEPIPVDLSLLWLARVGEAALALAENFVALALPNVVDFDLRVSIELGKSDAAARPAAPPAPPSLAQRAEVDLEQVKSALVRVDNDIAAEALRFKQYLHGARKELASLTAVALPGPKAAPPPPPAPPLPPLPSLGSVAAFAPPSLGAAIESAIEKRAFAWLEDLLEKLAEFLGTLLGMYGRASDLRDYDHQFRTLPLPWPAGIFQSDAVFAEMRVAGPNPVLLRRATAEDLAGFSLDDARYRGVTGDSDASVERALAAGAFYIADYSVLDSLEPGTTPQQKYVFAPRALFDVPAAGRRALRPIAVRTAQAAGAPVYFPGDGTPWEIAKLLVSMADGNYHELISHLGLTHLLTEPFVLATYRQLDPEHPLHALLAPHFAGTLLINYAAQTILIADGGAVDKLLAGTIGSGRALAANAVKAVRYNASFFPQTLADRGVDDARALPDYPYRDDALALWTAIHAWVSEYIATYYRTEDDVVRDYELQAWIEELVTAGKLQDIGEGPAGGPAQIRTTAYLAKLLTQVIFTASVQHAAVNFPQRTIMSYTPAFPLAAYAPFPAPAGEPATQVLDVLPPLQQALLQQAVLTGLGAVYYTALGQYGGELALRQVGDALGRFQERLQGIERQIRAANASGLRTPYTTLLPPSIPQSINI